MFQYFGRLQLLAEGGGAAGSAAGENGQAAAGPANTGEIDTAAAGLTGRLAELGVPQDKIAKRQKALERRSAARGQQTQQRTREPEKRTPEAGTAVPAETPKEAATVSRQEEAVGSGAPSEAAAGDAAVSGKEEGPAAGAKRLSWDEIKADPEYKAAYDREMQTAIKGRLGSARTAEERYGKIAPALEVLAGYYELDADPEKLDLDALAKRVTEDDRYYEDRAFAEGRTVAAVRERDMQARRERDLREQTIRQHYEGLRRQEAALKERYPTFDLQAELQNPAFARMVAPGSLVPLEDVYFAVHRQEILAAQKEAAEKAAAESMSRSIQAGQQRPVENGATPQAASQSTVNYRDPKYRAALKRQIYEAAARGEKLYPTR